jgi:hypothetical protein
MKLRIQENSIRIRLSIEELESLFLSEEVDMKTYTPSDTLITRLIPSGHTSVTLSGSQMNIFLSHKQIEHLKLSNAEGFKETIEFNPNGPLVLSVQKDYVCIGREENLNKGLFPNPKAIDGTC